MVPNSGLGRMSPVEVLHAAHHAGPRHALEVGLELLPGQREGRASRQREGEHRIEPRRIELRVLPLHERRRGRQRDEMRDVARHAVQHQQRRVGVGAADVHMLAEDGELLAEVAVQLRQLAKARLVVDAPLVPLLERMRAAADHGDVELVGVLHQRIADRRELRDHVLARVADPGRDLDHARRHLRHHAAGQRRLRHQAQHVLGIGREVVVVGVDQLQLEFHPQRQRLRLVEGFQRQYARHGLDGRHVLLDAHGWPGFGFGNGQPNAEVAEVSQKSQKRQKEIWKSFCGFCVTFFFLLRSVPAFLALMTDGPPSC